MWTRWCAFCREFCQRLSCDLGVALYHGEFAAVSAVMEHHGVPIDMEIFQQLADEDVWRAVRDEMVPAVDAQYGVYVRRNNSSDWIFSSMNCGSPISSARASTMPGRGWRPARSTCGAKPSRT